MNPSEPDTETHAIHRNYAPAPVHVTPELREEVFERDARATGWRGSPIVGADPVCVAPLLDENAGPCGGWTTLDHIQSGYGRMGKRAASDAEHLVSICSRHHLETGWATSHRPELRIYLSGVNR